MIPRVFDTDQHVTPPPDMWTKRMPKKYADTAPRVIELDDGGEAWSFEGGSYVHLFGMENLGAQDPAKYGYRARYDELLPAYWQPKPRLEAMDIDRIDATLLFPSVAGHMTVIQDDDLYTESVRAYNDGIHEWVQEGDPSRMFPVALIPLTGLETAMNELSRVAQMGFRHFQALQSPEGSGHPCPEHDPFWALAEETSMVVALHGGGASRVKRQVTTADRAAETSRPKPVASEIAIASTRAAGLGSPVTLAMFILTGIMERFPTLKFGMSETSVDWIPSYLERLDTQYRQHRWLTEQKLSMLPSEYFRRQVKASIDREMYGVKHRELLGTDRIMFGTDYPHMGNFFPHTRRYIDLVFDSVPEEDTHKMLWQNAADLYGVN
ncbi:amidohydrolase [Dehalococcoidia bacterium]|nr:amidohydrolase [Dehalococcoidia bacterium]